MCDNNLDCTDGSDENPVVCDEECPDDYFQCSLHRFCIPSRFVCDGDYDCLVNDTSDEENCKSKMLDELISFKIPFSDVSVVKLGAKM